mmetsp:Transcript_29337/g.44199  ORF Transcript_29337/g.44199 Transcript_29337/m.44199 type:complete len:234 (-) Transcript_29337:1292-1993(-)
MSTKCGRWLALDSTEQASSATASISPRGQTREPTSRPSIRTRSSSQNLKMDKENTITKSRSTKMKRRKTRQFLIQPKASVRSPKIRRVIRPQMKTRKPIERTARKKRERTDKPKSRRSRDTSLPGRSPTRSNLLLRSRRDSSKRGRRHCRSTPTYRRTASSKMRPSLSNTSFAQVTTQNSSCEYSRRVAASSRRVTPTMGTLHYSQDGSPPTTTMTASTTSSGSRLPVELSTI